MVTGALLESFPCQEANLARGRLDHLWIGSSNHKSPKLLPSDCHSLGLQVVLQNNRHYSLSRLPRLVSSYLTYVSHIPPVLQIYLTFNYYSQAELDFQLAWKSNPKLPFKYMHVSSYSHM